MLMRKGFLSIGSIPLGPIRSSVTFAAPLHSAPCTLAFSAKCDHLPLNDNVLFAESSSRRLACHVATLLLVRSYLLKRRGQ